MNMKEVADAFRRMAETIERNDGAPFGGAVVIIPPRGQATEMLFLDNRENPFQFFSNIKSIAEVSMGEILAEDQQQKAFGRPR